jgi:tetratricopeptide (TPR) repeat protein
MNPHPNLPGRSFSWSGLFAVCVCGGAVAGLPAKDTPPGRSATLPPIHAGATTAEPVAHPGAAVPADGALTNSQPAPESESSSSLRLATRFIANSNLNSGPHDFPKADRLHDFQMLLDLGRRQRAQKSNTQAKRNYVALLESQAPDSFHRAAIVELATLAQEEGQLARAQQLYAQYLKRWPEDSSVPEIYLRQGLLYRQMGAPVLALSKFYSVMTSALTLKSGKMDYYQRLVLRAQTEIADTYYLRGQHEDAAEFFVRLLKLEAAELNKPQIHFKLIRCMAAMGQHDQTIAQGQDFLSRYPDAPEQPEVQFLLAEAFKQSGQRGETLKHVLLLLESQQVAAREDRGRWSYWQRRAGNEIGNALYEEGDYLRALEVYSALAALDSSTGWQLPVWYQIALIYERLRQPHKAVATYRRLLDRQKELDSNASPGLKIVVDMARWRMELLNWQTQAESPGQTNAQATAAPPSSVLR